MRSNEKAREEQVQSQVLKHAPSLPEERKQKIQNESQEAQKIELVRNVMEARLDRLRNYKLTGDSKLWDKDYPERARKVQAFLNAIKGGSNKDGIVSASNELDYREKSLIRERIIPVWNSSVGDIQKLAIALIRADNGSDQVEAIAAKSLGDLFDKGVKKLESDTKAQNEIKRRANRDFGEMMKQGAFDNIDKPQQDAAQAGLEAMYQMRYIAKEYIDEKNGVPVPEILKHVWENYRDSLDIKDEWFTFSDTGKTQIASFLAYDLAPMIISGGVAGAVGKVAVSAATRATATMALRMPATAKYINSGTKAANLVKGSASLAGRATLATTEAVIFDASFEGIRNQRLFTDKPNWQQDLIKNAFGFGFSRYLAGAKSFAGMNLDPVSNQLIKQGFIVPAIITGVGVGQKLLANDPDAFHGAWEEFLLGAIMTGAFHMSGRVLEKKFPAKEVGIQKVEISKDGAEATITTPDGQKFTTRMTEKLKTAFAKLKKTSKNESSSANPNHTETAHGAPLEPAGPNVAKAENGGKLPEIKLPVGKNKTIQTSEPISSPAKLEIDKIKAKGQYRNESRLAKLHEGKTDTETILQKLQAEYARLRDAFHIPSDKQLKFDYFHTSEANGNRINSQMRVVKVGEDMFVQVKNNGVWETATEQNIIPKTPNARAEYDAYVQHQKDLLRSGVHNQIPDDVISMIDSGDLFKKQLNFDFYNNRSNSKMRVVELPNNEYLVQVKNNGVWETATEQNIIPKTPNARAEYDAYVQHQKDLLRSGVHNQFMKPEELERQMSDATNRLQRIDSLIQRESARPERPINDTTGVDNDTGKINNNKPLGQQSTLSHSDTIDPNAKVRIEREHGLDGSRQRYTEADIIKEGEAIIPGAGADIPGAIARGPNGVREFFDKYKKYLPWLLLISPVLLAIKSCDKSPEEKKAMEDICEECKSGPKSDLKYTRKSDANQRTLTENYRQDISKRWMKSKTWMEAMESFSKNRAAVTQNSAKTNNVATALDTVIKKGPTPENVQALQRCIGMAAEDVKTAQDGILGPITTAELVKVITSCIAPKDSPKPQKQADSSKTNNPPQTSPTNSDDVSSLPDTGTII